MNIHKLRIHHDGDEFDFEAFDSASFCENRIIHAPFQSVIFVSTLRIRLDGVTKYNQQLADNLLNKKLTIGFETADDKLSIFIPSAEMNYDVDLDGYDLRFVSRNTESVFVRALQRDDIIAEYRNMTSQYKPSCNPKIGNSGEFGNKQSEK